MKVLAQNRRARHDYQILETYEAGIVLSVQLRDAFVRTTCT